jgi:phosphoribosyl-AMP cyclohydrolase
MLQKKRVSARASCASGGPSFSASAAVAMNLQPAAEVNLYADDTSRARRRLGDEFVGYALRRSKVSGWRCADGTVMLTLRLNSPSRFRLCTMNDSQNTPAFAGPDGLVTAVAQDAATGEVLMVAHMNREAWDETLASGRAVYYSRARKRLWRKGEESGNVQHVREIYVDCDADTVLLKVEQVGGAACHEGYATCFFRQVTPNGWKVVGERVFDPKAVYGNPK